MELATAYEESVGVKSYVRHCVLQGGKVIITDKFSLAEEGEIDMHFLTHKKPELLEGGKISLTEGRVLSYSEALEPSVEEFTETDKAITGRWGTDTLYRIHLKAKVIVGEFTVTVE